MALGCSGHLGFLVLCCLVLSLFKRLKEHRHRLICRDKESLRGVASVVESGKYTDGLKA